MKFLRFFIMCLACTLSAVEAAAPATHVYFAQLWMDKVHIEDKEMQKTFIAGTLFPDIRYLGTISRDDTHVRGVTANQIASDDCLFRSGMLLHSLVDEVREKYIKTCLIMKNLKQIPKPFRVLFLKVLEDEIIWNQVRIQQSIEALQLDYPQALNAGVRLSTSQEWHRRLILYFGQPPSVFLKKLADQGKGFLQVDAATTAEWSHILVTYAKDPLFINYTNDMIEFVGMKMDLK